MPTVDFVYDSHCPNVQATRANLMRAFSLAGVMARWQEYEIGSVDAPAHVRGFGSPTILVDRVDIGGLAAGAEDCCRVYERGGVPSVELIAEALGRPQRKDGAYGEQTPSPPGGRWKSTAAVLPGIGIALMPKVLCPLCWPAYAAVLSAAGLTFLMEDRWLFPISVVLLCATLSALAWRARSRRGYGPLGVGAASTVAVLVGKFTLNSTATTYAGIAVLIAACIWNAWPHRSKEPACPACRPAA